MSKRHFLFIALCAALPIGLQAQETSAYPPPHFDFRQVSDVTPSVTTPTVVQLPLSGIFLERPDIAVQDPTIAWYEPILLQTLRHAEPLPVSARVSTGVPAVALVDGDLASTIQFDVSESGPDQIQITLTGAQPFTASGLSTLLAAHVALPTHIEIRAAVGGQEKIVVANQRLTQATVNFPSTVAAAWTITFTYTQPLRISELKLIQDDVKLSSTQHVRWLAQPGRTYKIYADADRDVSLFTGEAGNLSSDIDVVTLPAPVWQLNPVYIVADTDGDGAPDVTDNCVSEANRDQADVNANGRGDICDDFDKDGLINSRDNCPDNPNRGQADEDGDGLGDACDDEESRLTEAYPWLPWAGLGVAALVVVTLLAITTRSLLDQKQAGGAQNHPTGPSDSSSEETPTGREQG